MADVIEKPWRRIERTLAKVRELEAEQQAHVADLLEGLVEDHVTALPLSDQEERLIDEAIASIDAGRGVSGANLDAFWNRHRS
jgi:hypothetical protein